MTATTTMFHIVTGLKSRHEDVRNRTAQDLKKYVTTELREVSVDELTNFMDELNHHIFEMVSSSDVSEKKGGILAIGKIYFQGYFINYLVNYKKKCRGHHVCSLGNDKSNGEEIILIVSYNYNVVVAI